MFGALHCLGHVIFCFSSVLVAKLRQSAVIFRQRQYSWFFRFFVILAKIQKAKNVMNQTLMYIYHWLQAAIELSKPKMTLLEICSAIFDPRRAMFSSLLSLITNSATVYLELISTGQIISECLFLPPKKFDKFLPKYLKSGQIKKK